jgi:stage II sporulation protein D
MQISVGLTNTALTTLNHSFLLIQTHSAVQLLEIPVTQVLIGGNNGKQLIILHPISRGTQAGTDGGGAVHGAASANLRFSAKNNKLSIAGDYDAHLNDGQAILIRGNNVTAKFSISNISRQHAKNSSPPVYEGTLQIFAQGDNVRASLLCDLENYVRGVLQSEVPESYHLEAIKAQAIAARTYGLHPRVDHAPDNCMVCDSYLCCQYFGGANLKLSGRYLQAIETTKNEVLTWNDKPVLALFSSCSGGHTENYENCFSDQSNNAFPGEHLEYLRGVPEGDFSNFASNVGSEGFLKELWNKSKPETCDAWSTQFKWSVNLSADALEAHMHHVVAEELMNDPQSAPFIVPPPSNKFGHIKELSISKRGVSGTGMSLQIQTSTGTWQINKELVIRNAFKNPDVALKRLKSAKIFFQHTSGNLGLLEHLKIYGLGWGHGVGMQQTGAQGLALQGQGYKQILQHYFKSIKIDQA